MEGPVIVAVEIPQIGDDRHKNWAKVVASVDDSLGTGWAFEGEFIATGGIQDVPVGSVVLVYGEKGSRGNPVAEARAYVVHNDATVSLRATAKGRAWARTLRDPVSELLEESLPPSSGDLPWQPDLMRYSEDALNEELARRHGRPSD